MAAIFGKKYIFVPQADGTAAAVKVQFGDGRPATLNLIDVAGGDQPFRTQYDVTIGGKSYALAGGKGVGTYQFKLLDNVDYCNGSGGATTKESFATTQKTMGNYASRRVTITANGLVFHGLIELISHRTIVTDNGLTYNEITIIAGGYWV